MTGPAIVLVVAVAVLFAVGFDMLMQRSLIRVVVGFMLLGHGANLLLLLAGGAAGAPPLLGHESRRDMADPLPQAMALTAIVITFGVTAFLLALAYRSRMLLGEDEVRDDVEDARIHAERRHAAGTGRPDLEADPLEEEAERDDTEQEGTVPEGAGPRATGPEGTGSRDTESGGTGSDATGPDTTGRDETGGGA